LGTSGAEADVWVRGVETEPKRTETKKTDIKIAIFFIFISPFLKKFITLLDLIFLPKMEGWVKRNSWIQVDKSRGIASLHSQ
jgi:hypothetical protein